MRVKDEKLTPTIMPNTAVAKIVHDDVFYTEFLNSWCIVNNVFVSSNFFLLSPSMC